MAEKILKMVNITRRFVGITALDRVQFSCGRGEVHVLAEENGAGKSTILKILVRTHQTDEGEICFHGKEVEIRNPGRSQKLRITMVFQELTLMGEMTVWENIYLNQEPVTRLGRINRREIRKRILDAMDRYGIHIDPDATVGSLPVAKQQMAEILKILVRDPKLIILDELTFALAEKEVKQLYQTIHNLTAGGRTIISIPRRLKELLKLDRRITVLKDGCYIGTRSINEINEGGLIRMMVGHSLDHVFPPSVCQVDHSQVIFKVKSLADADHKLNHASFQVHEGEILGVVGLRGHGQTELLNAVSGLYFLPEGEITVSGRRVGIKDTGQAIAGGVTLAPSDRRNQGLMLELSNHHNLSISSMKRRMEGCFIDKRAEQALSGFMMSELSIEMGEPNLPVSSLSGGNQQKMVLGKGLATEPGMILFDEPTRGIGMGARWEFYQIIHGLAVRGVAVIMNSNDTLEVVGISSQAIVMYEEGVSGILEKEDLTEERITQFGMGLEDSRKVRKDEEQDE